MDVRRVVLIGLAVASIVGLTGCGSGAGGALTPHSPNTPAFRAHPPLSGSFISLWPACACGQHTVLDRFSLRDGRRMGTLATVPVKQGESLATPAVDRAARVWLTFSSGPLCTSGVAGCGPKPGSCAGRVERLDPRTGAATTVLTSPSSEQVSDVLPSPNARLVALVEGGCTSGYFNQHVVVRDLASGRQWSIGADARRCHGLTVPNWSPNGRELVFGYGPSVLSGHVHPAPGTCVAPRFNRLVIVSSQRSSRTTNWKPIRAQHRCSYMGATFDRQGVAAVESCVRSGVGSSLNVNTGRAVLVQLSRQGAIMRRIALKPGWERGAISTEPSGTVLVSQSQPANAGYPERDWVWQFGGRSLRLVASYPARDAAQVIAIPAVAP